MRWAGPIVVQGPDKDAVLGGGGGGEVGRVYAVGSRTRTCSPAEITVARQVGSRWRTAVMSMSRRYRHLRRVRRRCR